MKTVINIEDSSLEDILGKTPEILMKELQEGNPNIQVLATMPAPKENLFGFNYQKTTDEEKYTKLFQNQETIIRLAVRAKNDFGITPFAIIPRDLVRKSVIRTHSLYLWENLSANGAFGVNDFVSRWFKALYYVRQVYLEIIKFDSFGKWLDEKTNRTFASDQNLKLYFSNYKQKKNELEVKFRTKQASDFNEAELRDLFLFSLIPETTFIESVVTTISTSGSRFFNWLDFSKGKNPKVQKIRKEIDGLEESRKITKKEIGVRYQKFVSDFLQAFFNQEEYSQYRVFSESSNYNKIDVQFLDPPIDFFVLLKKMKDRGIQPVIIAEHDAVKFDLDEILKTPKGCPIVGYAIEGHIVFLKHYGSLSIEKRFKRSVVEAYVEHFLGEEYTN